VGCMPFALPLGTFQFANQLKDGNIPTKQPILSRACHSPSASGCFHPEVS